MMDRRSFLNLIASTPFLGAAAKLLPAAPVEPVESLVTCAVKVEGPSIVPGLRRVGTLTMTAAFDGDPLALLGAGKQPLSIEFPNGYTYSFDGLVTEVITSRPIDGETTAVISVRPEGSIVESAGPDHPETVMVIAGERMDLLEIEAPRLDRVQIDAFTFEDDV